MLRLAANEEQHWIIRLSSDTVIRTIHDQVRSQWNTGCAKYQPYHEDIRGFAAGGFTHEAPNFKSYRHLAAWKKVGVAAMI